MKFYVLWNRRAENELAEIWMQSAERSRVTDAARRVEMLLETNPLEVGESREINERRIVFVPPLAVLCHIVTTDSYVVITRVQLMKEP